MFLRYNSLSYFNISSNDKRMGGWIRLYIKNSLIRAHFHLFQ